MKTYKIAVSPMDHLCQKCFDMIQWRIDYRKYKPLTVLARCNYCQRKNITKAYRTICDNCANIPWEYKPVGLIGAPKEPIYEKKIKVKVEKVEKKEGEEDENEEEEEKEDAVEVVEAVESVKSVEEKPVAPKDLPPMKRCAKCCGPTTKYAHKVLDAKAQAKHEEAEDAEVWDVLNTLKEREKKTIQRKMQAGEIEWDPETKKLRHVEGGRDYEMDNSDDDDEDDDSGDDNKDDGSDSEEEMKVKKEK